MAGAERLYTAELLQLAVRLADYPADSSLPFQGTARSPSCGSTISMGLALDDAHAIVSVGMKVHACAVGQAAAAIFADGSPGKDRESVASARLALERWLSGEGALPDWPGISTIEAVRAYPGRHGALLLPWKAAEQALSNLDRNG